MRAMRLQPLKDRSQHALAFEERLAVVEPHHVEAGVIQGKGPEPVRLDGLRLEMLAAIELNDQAGLDTCEVGEIPVDRMLAPKLAPGELAISQPVPERVLGVRR